MLTFEQVFYGALAVLVVVAAYELFRRRLFSEGFTDGDAVPTFFGKYFPRRYDVVPGQTDEGDGWVRNPRYFEGYVDVQKLGYAADFCRVVEKKGMPETRMVACALGGQEGLDSLTFRTDSSRAGMRFSRDDYFRDVNGDGREDYGRILKVSEAPNDRWEARAVLAGLTRFKQSAEVPDNSPPPHIKDLLWFFEDIMVWYRWFDDMVDSAENTQLAIAGGAAVKEAVRPLTTTGLALNRIESVLMPLDGDAPVTASTQFLKIGENPKLEFENVVQLRQLRGVCVWAYFDEFTNNARIFDFGNGAGKDNVLLGIEGRGNRNDNGSGFGFLNTRPPSTAAVCQARAPPEVSPQMYMATSDANVDFWECPGPEPVDSTYPDDELTPEALTLTANLLFEVWDTQQRKMRIRVLNAIPLKKWVHIALTTTDANSIRPTWNVYIDGKKVHTEESGHMPLTAYTNKNYIGRSNWEGATSQYQDADERFRGALFDFRLYRAPLSDAKIARSVQWGKEKLGLKSLDEEEPELQTKDSKSSSTA
jgi:hypothetical protein